MAIIAPIPRAERRQMHRAIRKTNDRGFARRLTAMLMLHEGHTIRYVHQVLGAARSSIDRWINWYTDGGMEGLMSQPTGRPATLPMQQILVIAGLLIELSPQDLGYLRCRWSTELLAIEISRLFGISIAASTLRSWLPKADLVWRRAAPTLHIKDPHRDEKVKKINAALESCSREHPVFYEDEVDIDLNPKIGADWVPKGKQKRVATPGQNQKHYLAGALHAKTGKVLYVSGTRKNSALFIAMLKKLKRHYRGAKTITLVVDNYVIHKSRQTQAWIRRNPKFKLLFQPVYSPWINVIERLWNALHDTVTRNHQCRYMWQLLEHVRQFMAAASPFPGNGHGVAQLKSAI